MSRILVLGGGLIGRRHVERILAHDHARLVGLVDPDPEAASDLDVPRFADMAQVHGTVDGVIIATPSHLHADQGLAAARSGWPMLIEKPVATSLEDADRLIAGLSGVPALIGHHRRHHARVKLLDQLLKVEAIGTPITATLIWAMRKPDTYFAGNWRSAGGSPVLINLVHDLDLLRLWFGDITDVHALPGPDLRGSGRIESGSVVLRHDTGLTATISFADTAPSPWGFEAGTGENPNIGTTGQDMMWITGTHGAISFPSLTVWRGEDWSRPAEPHPTASSTNAPAPLNAQLDHFLDVIHGRTSPVCSAMDGRAALAAACEIEKQLHAYGMPCPSYAQA